MDYSFIQLLSFFFIYAFLGWCTEVIFVTVDTGKAVNRGFLNGPVCPIYGVGVVLVVSVLSPVSDSLLLLYICSVLLTSALEFVTGFILERVFHEKWWDYTGFPFNIKGYICLKFSLLWGVGCMIVVKVVHPFIEGVVSWLPRPVTVGLLCAFSAVFVADLVVTVITILKLPKRLKAILEVEESLTRVGDELSTKLSKSTVTVRETGEDISFGIREKGNEIAGNLRDRGAELKAAATERSDEITEELKRKKEELTRRLTELTSDSGFIRRRILKAYPQLGQGKYKEAFSKLRNGLKKYTDKKN